MNIYNFAMRHNNKENFCPTFLVVMTLQRLLRKVLKHRVQPFEARNMFPLKTTLPREVSTCRTRIQVTCDAWEVMFSRTYMAQSQVQTNKLGLSLSGSMPIE